MFMSVSAPAASLKQRSSTGRPATMPTLTADTESLSGWAEAERSSFRLRAQATASASAT